MVHECSIIQPRDSISDSKGARSRGRRGARLSFKDVTITYKKYTDGYASRRNNTNITRVTKRTTHKIKKCGFLLVFVIEAFEGQSAIMQERLHMLLENRLDEQENALVEDNLEMTRLGESNEQKAKRLIKDWTDKGFLTNYQNEEGEVIYEISSHTSKLMDWVVSLKKEDYIGTESKFKTLFAQLKELVEYSNEDREKRLELLRAKKWR